LRSMSEAAYLGLAAPRFMLRLPYGKKTDPIASFNFEEFTASAGLSGMLWGNPAVIAALLAGQTYTLQGQKMNLGSIMSVGDMPFHYYTDKDADQVPLPCTERLMTARMAALMTSQAFMPLISLKGRPEVRLGSFASLAGKILAGPWPEVPPLLPSKEEEPVAEATASEDSSADSGAEDSSDSETSSDDASAESESTDTADAAPEAEPEMDPELARMLKELG
jgi:hypothetical protein